ncbi:hypothetical protein [Pedobacter sp. R20-19]|uniref:hypothetical protein n=1 Tax=Pedobacter sp. R20-19 TaxID=1270196 RepID=UPI0004935C1B|nr:hypothetical protein [Pedobacter sp. R20-19]
MKDVFNCYSLAKKSVSENKKEYKMPEISEEIKILFTVMKSYRVANTIFMNNNTLKRNTVLQFTATLAGKMPDTDKNRMEKWLKVRFNSDKLKVVLE